MLSLENIQILSSRDFPFPILVSALFISCPINFSHVRLDLRPSEGPADDSKRAVGAEQITAYFQSITKQMAASVNATKKKQNPFKYRQCSFQERSHQIEKPNSRLIVKGRRGYIYILSVEKRMRLVVLSVQLRCACVCVRL